MYNIELRLNGSYYVVDDADLSDAASAFNALL